mmetsp:Transcript_20656/g.45080  ORF Transcript_20656/g.45080 Transcript_20656/m.45080 type:complete len:451 (-) Transcript_20656:1556-2908(-)
MNQPALPFKVDHTMKNRDRASFSARIKFMLIAFCCLLAINEIFEPRTSETGVVVDIVSAGTVQGNEILELGTNETGLVFDIVNAGKVEANEILESGTSETGVVNEILEAGTDETGLVVDIVNAGAVEANDILEAGTNETGLVVDIVNAGTVEANDILEAGTNETGLVVDIVNAGTVEGYTADSYQQYLLRKESLFVETDKLKRHFKHVYQEYDYDITHLVGESEGSPSGKTLKSSDILVVDKKEPHEFLFHFDKPVYLRNAFNRTVYRPNCKRQHVYCKADPAYQSQLGHIAHIAKMFRPCWSALQQYPNADKMFYLLDSHHEKLIHEKLYGNKWITDVFGLLNVSIVAKVDHGEDDGEGCIQTIVIKQSHPKLARQDTFLGTPTSSGEREAASYRDLIVSERAKNIVKSSQPRKLQIGIMDRTGRRMLYNPERIIHLIEKKIPTCGRDL